MVRVPIFMLPLTKDGDTKFHQPIRHFVLVLVLSRSGQWWKLDNYEYAGPVSGV